VVIDLLNEIDAGLHGVDIHEKIAAGELLRDAVEQPPGHTGRIVATIIDEYACHRQVPRPSI
jgi:hypothetical protein